MQTSSAARAPSVVAAVLCLALGSPAGSLAQGDEVDPVAAMPTDVGDASGMRGPVGAQVAGGVSIDEIRWSLNRRRRDLEQCFEDRIFDPRVVLGRIVVTFVISPTGAVTGAAVSNSTVDDLEVERCVVEAVLRVTFPRTDDALPLVVVYAVISREYLPTWNQPIVFASPERWRW